MEYVALAYLHDQGKLIVPGEIVHGMDERTAERLIRKGAIRAASAEEAEAPEAGSPGNGDAPENEVPNNGPDAETEEAEEAEEPVEIDALDGVVAAPAEETKPAKKGGRKAK